MASARVSRSLAIPFFALAVYAQRPRPANPPPPFNAPAVAGISPFPASCNGIQGTSLNHHNAPVEPFVAVDPSNPRHIVGVWQQDRWSDGGASGLMAGASVDGGRTWTNSYAPFSMCSGGSYERASDPWVAIAPDSTVYQIALALNGVSNGNAQATAVLVSRSSDGGLTWGAPTAIVEHNAPIDDKEAITADPGDAHYVYAIWDRATSNGVAAWFSRTTDGGVTWEPARIIYSSGNAYATANQIVVLPDGTLVDAFVWTVGNSIWIAAMRSADHGVTWSNPAIVSTDLSIGTVDPNTQVELRTGAGIPAAAVDRNSGAIYVVWQDGRFSGNQRDGIALSKSTDGGITWSKPVPVNQAPNTQAFTPAVAVGADGSVAVTYFDFRKDTGATGTLLTNYWNIISNDGGATWTETPVAGPFDILTATLSGSSPFLGDYQGLAAAGSQFLAFYVAANSGDANNPTSVFASSESRPGDTRSTLRTEINLRPHPYKPREEPPKK